MSRRALFGICICIFARHMLAVFRDTNYTKFILHRKYSGLFCPVDSTIFIDYGNVENCVLKCYKTPSCYGVFVHYEQLLCAGCGKPYITIDDGEMRSLKGTSYFRRHTFLKVDEKRKWEESKKHCEDLGGYLADIKSEEEERFIEDHFWPDINNDIWIGATDSSNEDNFLWCDGSQVSDFYHNWADNEPDIGLEDEDDHCVILRNNSTVIAWRDSYCGSYFASLCEFD